MSASTRTDPTTTTTTNTTTERVVVVAHRDKLAKNDEKRLRAALHDGGLDPAGWQSIAKGKYAARAATKAVADGATVVVVCGGDGTVRAAAGALVDTGVALAVMPSGTANLFAGALDLPSEPTDIVELIRSGQRRTIDTGTCNGQAFVVMAGTGFDAAMVDGAEDGKERFGMLAYLRAGVREARQREPFQVTVRVDGTELFDGEATCVLVGNVGTLKGGLEAFPDASVTDGLLDVAVLTAAGVREWASVMVAAVRHQQRTAAGVQLAQGRKVVVKLDGEHRFELDGGMKGGATKLKFAVRPASLRLCAPVVTPTQ